MKIYKFYSQACGPCASLSKQIGMITHGNEIIDVNIDHPTSYDLIEKFGIMSVPTMVKVNEDDKELVTMIGHIPDKVKPFLQNREYS